MHDFYISHRFSDGLSITIILMNKKITIKEIIMRNLRHHFLSHWQSHVYAQSSKNYPYLLIRVDDKYQNYG